jgi:hypothetical protein
MIFANAGALGDHLGRFIDTAIDIIRQNTNVVVAADTFEKVVLPRSTALAKDLKQQQPGYYDKNFEGQSLYSVIFANMTPIGAQLVIRDYSPVSSTKLGAPTIQVKPQQCLQNCSPGTRGIIGHQQAAEDFFEQTPNFILQHDAIDIVRKSIDLEIVDKPLKVGPRVAIVKATLSGIEWVQRGVCR